MDNQDIETGKLDDLKDSIATDMASLEDLYAEGPKKSEVAKETASWTEAAKPAKAEEQGADDVSQKTPPPKPKAKASDDEDGDEPDDVQGLKAALKATRQKARERAERLKEYEERLTAEQRRAAEADHVARQLAAQRQQGQQPQQELPPPPDPLVDPQGALEYRDRVWADVIRQRDEQYRQQWEAIQQETYMARLVPSQRMMRQQYQDYEEMEKLFAETANADPRLWQEIRRQEFPAEYAYQVGKRIKQSHEIQKSGGWESWLEQKVEEKLNARQNQLQAQPTPQVPSMQAPSAPKAPPPQSLARMPSVTPRNQAKSYNGPTPISDLYK
jgi:hypothetical protein